MVSRDLINPFVTLIVSAFWRLWRLSKLRNQSKKRFEFLISTRIIFNFYPFFKNKIFEANTAKIEVHFVSIMRYQRNNYV